MTTQLTVNPTGLIGHARQFVFILMATLPLQGFGWVPVQFTKLEFIMLKGEGVDVCEDYRKNREALALISSFKHRIHPDFSNIFIEPDWFVPKKSEYNLFRSRIKSLYQEDRQKYYPDRIFPPFGDDNLYGKPIKPNTLGQPDIILTWFDINNDGSDELVAIYYRHSLVVTDPVSRLVDRNLSKLLLLNFSTTVEEINAADHTLKGAGKWAGVKYNTFQYKGRSYIIRQATHHLEGKETFSLYTINHAVVEQVCVYQNNSIFTWVPQAHPSYRPRNLEQ